MAGPFSSVSGKLKKKSEKNELFAFRFCSRFVGLLATTGFACAVDNFHCSCKCKCLVFILVSGGT